MQGLFDFVVKPKGSRYNNVKKIGDKELILNSEIFNHQYVNREAVVVSTPKIIPTDIKPGDTIIVHHNVFRRWHDQQGVERNSRGYFKEDKYFVSMDQIYLYQNKDGWFSLPDYCFVKPIVSKEDMWAEDKEKPLVGIVKYTNKKLSLKKGDLIGFTPNSEYEFIIEKERLYRVLSKFITIKYEYQGDEKEYNPSWT
jgi:hypothetical protein|tara:strand:+ start:12425 stop:13015 length:591 start_codon:yes stop_codon:yes gene_type:complete